MASEIIGAPHIQSGVNVGVSYGLGISVSTFALGFLRFRLTIRA